LSLFFSKLWGVVKSRYHFFIERYLYIELMWNKTNSFGQFWKSPSFKNDF